MIHNDSWDSGFMVGFMEDSWGFMVTVPIIDTLLWHIMVTVPNIDRDSW
ncbi:MAG: hypothetical protein JXR91_15935 [Deltaproteobacteria bacterium]|nr:hypothetical protein [Deltaproteobacteria bacterium]